MHYSKTYGQLLLTLPQELRNHAIEYRQLKKLINQVVLELSSLGLSPDVLHGLLKTGKLENGIGASGEPVVIISAKGKELAVEVDAAHSPVENKLNRSTSPPSRAVYELVDAGNRIEPRLRLWVGTDLSAQLDGNGTGSAHNSPTEEARVAIFLEAEQSYTGSEITSDGSDRSHSSTEDLVALSKPIASKKPGHSLLWTLQRRDNSPERTDSINNAESQWNDTENTNNSVEDIFTDNLHIVGLVKHRHNTGSNGSREVVVPLIYDAAFFQLLRQALIGLATHLLSVRQEFIHSLKILTRTISNSARPQSSVSRFHAYSATANPNEVQTPSVSPFSTSFIPGTSGGSDLNAWREIFVLYIETEIFESVSERYHGERTIEDSDERLAQFAERVTERGLNDTRKLRLKESRDALEKFLELNVLILNLKKFQSANAEAARKILKKHSKRTALPFPNGSLSLTLCQNGDETREFPEVLGLIPTTTKSLPHVLVQAIGEILLPIIPHIDDYECLICTSIAFKPIRLSCGHLFCVRCLVKMQKAGKGNCPICRRETVLQADRSNVDWALLNFMQDWFPKESKEKQKMNEKEATKEQMEELGLSDRGCILM